MTNLEKLLNYVKTLDKEEVKNLKGEFWFAVGQHNENNEYLNFDSFRSINETVELLKEYGIKEITVEHENNKTFMKLQKLGWIISGMTEIKNHYSGFNGEYETRPVFLLRNVL